MATPAHQLSRFQLPARIRASKPGSEMLKQRLPVVDRIAELPGIEVVEYDGDTLPRQTNVYLHGVCARRSIRNPRSLLLCDVGVGGIAVCGLDNWAKHQVVMRGWGRLVNDRVLLHLPRDDNEIEICWSILRQAYSSLFDPSACSPANKRSTWDMPKYSRTTLQ